ncbi:glutamate decarboxylase [Ophiocordyceps camponoti-floridani]|uniref:Glutamate decarboxylase n=1 Tax=Ophiocordyceps camponoti-floridani TaxID=2030778 RepID=A0A8H4Q8J6_9HYPO|nr:glutamate decarboxylase [Ophiocordyceps camponoti-floridani]
MVHLTAVQHPAKPKAELAIQLSSDADDFSTSVYGSSFAARGLPRTRMPEEQMPREVAYRMIHDDLSLDNNPRLNLASFVTTYMEEEAEKLMTESMAKNFIDYEEYPHSADLQSRCVSMLGDLFHAPGSETGISALGTATVGSSEAIMLAVLALKKRWASRRREAGKPVDKPNLIMSSAVQVCWEKATRYLDIEERLVFCAPDRFVVDAEEMVGLCDENTIGCVLILGTTYTGHYEDVKAVSDLLVERGVDVPIHVDAASGGFVAPFIVPDLEWDFRCEKVVSINVSGHKYGLVYPGVGWALWRSPEDLPQELVFNIDYLGAQQSSFTLNFSKGASQIVGQYYQLIRLGRRGYRDIMSNLVRNADYLASSLRDQGFVILSEGAGGGLPLVAFRLATKKDRQYDEFALAHQLRARGWVVPAYTMAPKTDRMKLLRIVVREDLSRGLVDALVADVKLCIELLDQMDQESIKRMGEFVRQNVSATASAGKHHQGRHHPKQKAHSSYKGEDHSLQGKTGKTHAAC